MKSMVHNSPSLTRAAASRLGTYNVKISAPTRQYTKNQSTELVEPTGKNDAPRFRVWQSLVFSAVCGGGLLYYFNEERKRMEQKRRLEAAGVVGTPKIGGPIQLTDQNGEPFDSNTLKNSFMIVYFGFTHCPDICPEELDKISKVMGLVEKIDRTKKIVPVFITVDPERDGSKEIKDYLADFHPAIVGLTGNKEEVKAVAKKYRVYFRPAKTGGSETTKSGDYLVDHSIFIFLVDPEGRYVTHFGRESTPDRCAKVIIDALESWDHSN